MKRALIAHAVLLLALMMPHDPLAAEGQEASPRFREGEVLIKYRPDVSRSEQQLHNTQFGAIRIREMRRLRLHHLRLPKGITVEEGIEMFRRNPKVMYAEPNYINSIDATTPNDPGFGQLWGLDNTGQSVFGSAGTPDADIDAPEAWDLATGDGSVAVGIIDTGADYDHEDLSANMWTNPGEAGNCSDGIDNDANGYVDDCRGWDFYNDDNDPMDDHSHGTRIAGIVGAIGNNGVGISGVNWQVKIVPLKTFGASGDGTVADEIAAIDYATDAGIRFLNGSYSRREYSQAEKDAIDAFAASGGIFVAAAGNNARDIDPSPRYPASHTSENMIAVASTDQDDGLSAFSNYGTSVHVAAPGENVYSTAPSDSYATGNGTSFAAPHVCGLAALIAAHNGTYTGKQIREVILKSVDVLASLGGKVLTGGRINAYSALALDLSAAAPAPPNHLDVDDFSASQIDISWVDNSTMETGFKLERRTGTSGTFSEIATRGANATSYSDTGLDSSTRYYYRILAFNAIGNSPYSNVTSATTLASSPPPPPPPPPSSGGGGGSCFIATAAYGDPGHPDIALLRDFRDRYLLTNAPGKAFVDIYYQYSPPVAEYVSRHPALRLAARTAIAPVVVTIKHPKLAFIAFCAFLGAAIYRRGKRMKDKGFTLIEVLIVVFILSLLAALVAPKLIGRTEDAKIAEAQVQIRNFETAINLFRLDNGFYPSTEQGLAALVEKPTSGKIPQKYREGGYLEKSSIPLDPWGNPYIYASPGLHGDIDILSLGSDSAEGGEGTAADINNWDIN